MMQGSAGTKYRRVLPHLPNQSIFFLSAPAAGTALPQRCFFVCSCKWHGSHIYLHLLYAYTGQTACCGSPPRPSPSKLTMRVMRPGDRTVQPCLGFHATGHSTVDNGDEPFHGPRYRYHSTHPISCLALPCHGSLSPRYCRHRQAARRTT